MEQEFTPPQLKWLEALESGKFLQTRGHLHDRQGFCCLGVACEISELEIETYTYGSGIVSYDKRADELPHEVKEELHLYTSYGQAAPHAGYPAGSLILLNDDERKSFKQIAALIRKHPDWYFTNFKSEQDVVRETEVEDNLDIGVDDATDPGEVS